MKKTFLTTSFALLALASFITSAHADTSASRNYTMIADTVDAAGGKLSSATYAAQGSLGGIGGSSSGTVGRTVMNLGYIAQIQGIASASVIHLTTSPVLTIVQSGNAVILSWPGESTGFSLEWTDTLLSPITWQPAVTSQTPVDGKFSVTNQLSGFVRFYHLRAP